MRFKSLAYDFLELFYPEECPGCCRIFVKGETLLCTDCLFHLPRTQFHLFPHNEAAQLLWGRVPFRALTSFLFFKKGSRVESLMYAIKYRRAGALAFQLGKMFGREIRESGWFSGIEGIVPVPLHPRRESQRGYNQSLLIAKGISESIDVPVFPTVLETVSSRESITEKGRVARWESLRSTIALRSPEDVCGKSILLVDDVLTTGATLEVCAEALWQADIRDLCFATLARRQ